MFDTPEGPRLYQAAQLPDRKLKIPNWRVLDDTEAPQPGDIGAYASPSYPIASGHAAIIARCSTCTGGITTIGTNDEVILQDDDQCRWRQLGGRL